MCFSDGEIPLRQKSHADGHRRAIDDGCGELFEISSRCHHLLNICLCNQSSERFAWTGVRTSTEGKHLSVLHEDVELLRAGIERWITIGGCQNDKNTITLLHGLTGNTSILSKVAARVLPITALQTVMPVMLIFRRQAYLSRAARLLLKTLVPQADDVGDSSNE